MILLNFYNAAWNKRKIKKIKLIRKRERMDERRGSAAGSRNSEPYGDAKNRQPTGIEPYRDFKQWVTRVPLGGNLLCGETPPEQENIHFAEMPPNR